MRDRFGFFSSLYHRLSLGLVMYPEGILHARLL
jgi:hypothetical protein